MAFFKILFISVLFIVFFSSCDVNTHTVGNKNISSSYKPSGYFAILGPISDANVNIIDVDKNISIYRTKTRTYDAKSTTLVWGEYVVGSFEVDISANLDKSTWVNIEVDSGVDIDSNDDGVVTNSFIPLNGKMKAYCKMEDLSSSYVIVNILTTIGVELYIANAATESRGMEEYLNDFANSIFIKSVDRYVGIDYRDLFAYIPNKTSTLYLKTPSLYKNLLEYGVMDSVLNNLDLYNMLNEDKDLDGLTLWFELLHNSSPNLIDTDFDGIDDNIEIAQGLNPASRDSDFDGIDDGSEYLHGTSPLKPDSDVDFIPDNIELKQNTNPLDADENLNGVEDGLDGDPFFKYQWYIKSLGNIVANSVEVSTILGNDLGILDVYHRVLGNNNGYSTVIQVIDSGVELKHEDIDVDLNNSFNAITKTNDPTPTSAVLKSDFTSPLDSGHGTAVAGIIAAKTNNGLGVRGIVPRAKIAGSNWLEDQTLGELERVWYTQIDDDKIVVSNNSWGAFYLKDDGFERILALATTQLRQGRGRVYTFAAGNSREEYGNTNLSYLTNNPYVITVASLNSEDKYASYSNPGSNILVSAYGGEHYYTAPTIMTTSLSGESYFENELNGAKGVITVDEDSKKSYTYAMNGTSSATPMVSGSIALLIDACPTLSWRDVRWIIANTSKMVDKLNKTWVKNGAGLYYSTDYGYGKIDTLAMIEMCRSDYFTPLADMKHIKVDVKNVNLLMPDNNTTVIKEIVFLNNLKIEWVGLTIETLHPFAGDIEINLISPMGTKINIIKPNELTFAGYKDGFRFSTVAYIDENSNGTWRIEFTDRLDNDEGILKSIGLEVYGYED